MLQKSIAESREIQAFENAPVKTIQACTAPVEQERFWTSRHFVGRSSVFLNMVPRLRIAKRLESAREASEDETSLSENP